MVFLNPYYHGLFATRSQWRLNSNLFKRLLNFGVPVGIQIQLESLAWTVFVLLIGSIGINELTAHSIVMSIFMLLVMPMAGISVAVSVLVATRIGEGNIPMAERVTHSAIHLGAVLFAGLLIMLVGYPDWILAFFIKGLEVELYQSIAPLLQDLLLMVAVFCLFQTLSMMLAGTLKGAGDTRFVAWGGIAVVWGVLVLPAGLWEQFMGGNLRVSWGFMVLSGVATFALYGFRYRQSKWKAMSVVDAKRSATCLPSIETAD